MQCDSHHTLQYFRLPDNTGIVAVGYATFVVDASAVMTWDLFEDDGAITVE